jgi:hypothetical protein
MVFSIRVGLQFLFLVIKILVGQVIVQIDGLLLSYTDSNWACDSLDRWYTTGYIFQLGSCLISWSRKKLRTLSLSSCEAE